MKDLKAMAVELRDTAADMLAEADLLIERAEQLEREAGRLKEAAALLEEPQTALERVPAQEQQPPSVDDHLMPPVIDAPFGFDQNGVPLAPYGISAKTGKIRKNRGRPTKAEGGKVNPPSSYKKMAETKAAKAANGIPPGPRPKVSEQRLRVLSSTHPTERELKDRELAHTTEEPA